MNRVVEKITKKQKQKNCHSILATMASAQHNVTNYSPPAQWSQWNAPFCGCFDDCGSCCMACWCPCVQFGLNMEDAGLGDCFLCGIACLAIHMFTGCGCILTFLKRSDLRRAYGIEGNEFEDCCAHFWCLCCALSQEAREIRTRGRVPDGCQQS